MKPKEQKAVLKRAKILAECGKVVEEAFASINPT
jgi:hypothetical protein